MPSPLFLPDRRRFLTLAGGGAVAIAAGMMASSAPAVADPRFASDPFTLGVASGDPLPHGVVLWTRLALDPIAPDGSGWFS
jgi:alkaline phosphatase D